MWWYSEWSPNRYAANGAFVCYLISRYTYDDLPLDFAIQQAEYVLGSSGRSYVIGYSGGFEGPKVSWPKTPHHRGSSCPTDFSVPCGEDFMYMSKNPNPNVNILFGALVGGPDKMDNFKNDRENYRTNEVALDYNAAYQGLMAAMLHNDMIKANLIELKETFSAIPDNELLREARRDVPKDPFYNSESTIMLSLTLSLIFLI